MRAGILCILSGVIFGVFLTPVPARAAEPLHVFTAASFGDVVEALAETFQTDTGRAVRIVAMASSTAARQIDAGAPADLFVSASPVWMDWLAERGRIAAGTRTPVAGNRLVVVAPAGDARTLTLGAAALLDRLGSGRLAVGDPDHVPAGIYARAALQQAGLWEAVSGRLAPAQNVRVALAYVSEGEAPLGIVYRSDAAADGGVAIVAEFDAASHPPIVYPAAAVADGDVAAARQFLDLLTSDKGHAALRENGFSPP